MDALYKWLLEDSNPAIKYRTQKELLNQNVDNEAVKKWILDKVPASWYETNGLWYRYYVAALAECGLSKQDVELEKFSKAFDELNNKFEWSCADFMLLTSLVKLGFQEHETIKRVIEEWNKCSLTDGGFLCSQKLKKFDYVPKSCYKVNLHQVPSIQHYRFKYGIAKHVGSSDLTVCERTARIIAGFFFFRETCFSSLLRLLLQTKSDIVTALNTPLFRKER